MLVEDTCIKVDVNQVPERVDLLHETFVQSGVDFVVSGTLKVEREFIGFESSHPKEDIDQVFGIKNCLKLPNSFTSEHNSFTLDVISLSCSSYYGVSVLS